MELAERGCININSLLGAANKNNCSVAIDELRRWSKRTIRNGFQITRVLPRFVRTLGHSINVELAYQPHVSSELLHHSTALRSIASEG